MRYSFRYRDGRTFASNVDIEPPPGGGSQPEQASYLSADYLAINNGDLANLLWDTLDAGTDLLDRTDPANPLFLTTGFYAISVCVTADGLSANGYAQLSLTWSNGESDVRGVMIPASPVVSLAATGHVEDTTLPLQLPMLNEDGVASRGFAIAHATIVKLA